jgi:hypothetical protein
MPRIGILDSLEPEQKEQLMTWLSNLEIAQVLDKVAAPPPEGFGIKTHITSLRRFYQREKIREAQENVNFARAACTQASDLEIIHTAAFTALTHRAFESAIAPDLAGSHLPAAAKWLLALQDNEFRREQLQLRRERLELEKRKLLIDTELKEVGILQSGDSRISDTARAFLKPDARKPQ